MKDYRRVRLNRIGWEEDLTVETGAKPWEGPSGDQVEVAVEACGICYRDLIDRSGRFKFIALPVTPGHEAVGRVTAVGPDVKDWRVGDRVATMHRDYCGECDPCLEGNSSLCERAGALLGLTVDGGYASHLLVPQRALFPVPEDLPAAEAAVLHCTFGTAYRGLKRFGRLVAGGHALVTGANGGVGSAAMQVASRLGASVTAVVRSPEHADFLSRLGASAVIVDEGGGFHKKISGRRADVAIDCVGQPTFNAALRSLRPGGRMVVVGNIVAEAAAVNLGYLVTRGLQVIGSSGATREDMRELIAMHREKPLHVAVHHELDLAQADRGQRLVKAGGLRGRILLRADPGER